MLTYFCPWNLNLHIAIVLLRLRAHFSVEIKRYKSRIRIRLLVEHKAVHSFLQFFLSLNLHCTSCQLDHPISCLSLYTVLHQVSFGLPFFLFSTEAQVIAAFVFSSLLNMCPIYNNLLFFTFSSILSSFVLSMSSLLEILLGQYIFKILLRHLFWNVLHILRSPLFVFQHFVPYNRKTKQCTHYLLCINVQGQHSCL